MAAVAPPDNQKKIRTFIALNTPAEWEQPLRAAQQNLKRELKSNGIKWVNPEQIHITLRFLGYIFPAQVDDLIFALNSSVAGLSPFALSAGALGCFPSPRRPRVIWIGLEGDLNQLTKLHKRINERTASIGEPPDDRPFQPHLTLARVKQIDRTEVTTLERALAAPPNLVARWNVSELLLMRSDLSPQGARYAVLHSAVFQS